MPPAPITTWALLPSCCLAPHPAALRIDGSVPVLFLNRALQQRLGARTFATWPCTFCRRGLRNSPHCPMSHSVGPPALQKGLVHQWVAADPNMKKQVKANLLATLGTQVRWHAGSTNRGSSAWMLASRGSF